MLPPPLSPAACMHITMNIMNVIEIRLNLRFIRMILWPNVDPEERVITEKYGISVWNGIEVFGAVCVSMSASVVFPNKPGIGKVTFARNVDCSGFGKVPSAMN